VPAGHVAGGLVRRVSEDHDRELQPLRFVYGHHPYAFRSLLDDRRFVHLSLLCVVFDVLDKGPERGYASLEVPGHVDHSLTVCERLLTILPEGNARMGPDGLQQHGDGLRDGPVIAPRV
jgi:hypothetical protein